MDKLERLRRVESSDCGQGGFTTNWYRNPDGPEAADEITRLNAEVERLTEALTPSGATKAAYIGEFSFVIDEQDDEQMCEVTRKVDVPWTTIKEIMEAIRARALILNGKDANVG